MLKIENLTKIYGEKKAVDNLSLHIKFSGGCRHKAGANKKVCGYV